MSDKMVKKGNTIKTVRLDGLKIFKKSKNSPRAELRGDMEKEFLKFGIEKGLKNGNICFKIVSPHNVKLAKARYDHCGKVLPDIKLNEKGDFYILTRLPYDTKLVKQGDIEIKVVSQDAVKTILSESDAEMDARAQEAVKAAIERAKVCKKPIARYDPIAKKSYMEYPDGTRKYSE